MTGPANYPLYVVVEEESRKILVAAEEVTGFFVGSPHDEAAEVEFLGIHEIAAGRHRVDDAILEIMNYRQEKIGEYFVGRVVRSDAYDYATGGQFAKVAYTVFGNRCEYPEAAAIWRHWASDVALLKGEWRRGDASYQSAWLHVVQNSWFASGRSGASRSFDGVARLDGIDILTSSAFYCALGEAIYGPAGYFGTNLDALAECISSTCESERLREVVWQDFSFSRNVLGDSFTESIVELMREFGVSVVI
ncbi:barstar family protein [Amycolatopsis sp. TNS106]|uniref:barstar family protein n=1 Tax=Amycolatopsis sp. TNS106 TaxID=2861750 RepID=UPI001C55CE8B|nr:barstar family protein [Amycolatopsis sp. TNS106]QXV58748.1 hypothetical protein CVV72_18305 [Amycolatopsis sp. TNS106]